jgi:PAS domain S-box-containing protein
VRSSLLLPANDNAVDALTALRVSESRYRRLFETALDGILLLNAESAQIEDVNPYLINMLGYSHAEFLGKKLWEVGAFADIAQNKEMFEELQAKGYVRYEYLPLRTKAGNLIEVEFVSNTYDCEGIKVIQCNIRDITVRKRAERELAESKAHLHQLTIFLQHAREDDRVHFARELHDELGQNLTALRMDFKSLANGLATKDAAIAARLAAIDRTIDSTVEATRLICEKLRPGMLDDLGLEAALSSYTRNFSKQFGVPCDLLLDCEDYGLDKLLSTSIFRIVQESLTNIARHARASHAMVALQARGEDLTLTIADDGCGMSAAPTGERRTYVERRTFGMLGMRERVTMLGGRIEIDSAPGRGTHIEVSIPRSAPPVQ